MIQDMPSDNEYIDEFIQQQLMGDKDLREMVESFDLDNFLNNDQEQDNELMIWCENSSSATSGTSQSCSTEFSMQQDKNCNLISDAFNIQENGINPDNFIENKAIKNNDLPHEPPIKCLKVCCPVKII
uniref:Uncharacterized protein n=1 Tax=Acrobeloides nanus TaxID=290746 RepID=A0A914EFJ3_9BILA